MRTKPITYNDGRLAEPTGISAGIARQIGARLLHEVHEALPPTIFFFVGFNFIVLTTNLLVAQYLVAVSNFMLATLAALVVGKAVLVANKIALLRRYDRAPLIQPILFKTAFYWVVVFLARLLERFVHFALRAIRRAISSLIWVITFFAYHAVPTSFPALGAFRLHTICLWRRALRRRSQKDRVTWQRIEQLAADFLPTPRILHPWPSDRFAVKHPRWGRMRESRTYGSVRGAPSNGRPYRDPPLRLQGLRAALVANTGRLRIQGYETTRV